METRRDHRTLWVLALALALLAGCSDQGSDDAPPEDTALADTEAPDAEAPDAEAPDAEAPDAEDTPDTSPRPSPGDPVAIDLAPLTAGAPQPADQVRVFISDDPSQLAQGVWAQGQVGDVVLENGRARVVIEADTRVSSPCPYGGNVIDASARTADGAWSDDVLGELCLFANIGQTLDPESYEIVADGSDGGAGVLAVTGHLAVLDFIHLVGMARSYVGADVIAFLPVNPEVLEPLTVTVYYIMRPGDPGVRVVTALRNDGDETLHVPLAQLIHSGGDGAPFSPLDPGGGFGIKALSADNLASTPTSFLAFSAPEATFAYVPEPDPRLSAPLPVGGSYASVAGVTISLVGLTDILGFLLTPARGLEDVEGLLHLPPGASDTTAHWHLIGPSLSAVIDEVYPRLDVPTGRVEGQVRDADDAPVTGALVTAFDPDGRPLNQAQTDADGRYAMLAPEGALTVRARAPGRPSTEAVAVDSVPGAAAAQADLTLPPLTTLTVRARTPDGAPTPARVLVRCVDACDWMPEGDEVDVETDRLPSGAAASVFLGVDGDVTLPLGPGQYRVAVTHGMEWSIWPQDAIQTGGALIDLAAGDAASLDAEIAHVVDTSGALSADFHVHAIRSPDSTIRNPTRVRSFLAEGVDVLVATDHDMVTDMTDDIAALGAQAHIASVVGVELTTPNYGHYNTFPLPYDPAHRTGGGLDWGQGPDYGMTPGEIFAWSRAQGDDVVVQVNHPSSGMFGSLEADPLRGTTAAPPDAFRLPPSEPNPQTGDTGLWSDDFTALEVMNGHSTTSMWRITRWWLALVGRGMTATATAVSDTHKLRRDLGGAPRSFVFVDDDALTSFSPSTMARAVNEGRVIGSNGPFFRAVAQNASGARASLGDTLAVEGAAVEVTVSIDIPAWMQVDTVDVYVNLDEATLGDMLAPATDPLPPSLRVPVDLGDATLQVAAQGTLTHSHRVAEVRFTVETDVDAYVVLVVHDREGTASMQPVIFSDVRPLAFSNPIYLDADGDGYDHPPLADAAQDKSRASTRVTPRPVQVRPLTLDDIRHLLERFHH